MQSLFHQLIPSGPPLPHHVSPFNRPVSAGGIYSVIEKKAVEIYSYYPSIHKEVFDQRIEIEKCKLKVSELTLALDSYKKAFDDTVDISTRFHK